MVRKKVSAPTPRRGPKLTASPSVLDNRIPPSNAKALGAFLRAIDRHSRVSIARGSDLADSMSPVVGDIILATQAAVARGRTPARDTIDRASARLADVLRRRAGMSEIQALEEADRISNHVISTRGRYSPDQLENEAQSLASGASNAQEISRGGQYQWVSYDDGKSGERHHEKMDGLIGPPFTTYLGNVCQYPGDPALPVGDRAGCRCTIKRVRT